MLVRDTRFSVSGGAAMAPEDGAGGGAAPQDPGQKGAPPSLPGQVPQNGATPPAAGDGQQPPPVYRPDGLPDHLFGKSDKETIDHLFKAFGGYRTAEAQRVEKYGAIPKELAGYKANLPDDLKAYVPELDKDPVYLGFQKRAHDLGITDKQFDGIVQGFFRDTIEQGGVEEPYNAEKERDALIPPAEIPDPAERAREVDRRSRDAMTYVDVLTSRGLDQASADMVKGWLDTAAGIKFVEFFRTQLRETQPALGGGAAGITHADLKTRMADPKNDPRDPKYDSAFAAETTRLYRQVLGNQPRA